MLIFSAFIILAFLGCTSNSRKRLSISKQEINSKNSSKIIVDCHYTFDEAIFGTKAPASIIKQLQLMDVTYYSIDGKLHKGQILTNKKMVCKLESIFRFILQHKFPIEHAIPIVKYNWDDNLSMEANNTYSFCYRDISYSKHAMGMAIDINPCFNPERWKKGYEYRLNKPKGAHYNPKIAGTFYNGNPVVEQFKKLGFHWGHNFSMKYDDHHFEL